MGIVIGVVIGGVVGGIFCVFFCKGIWCKIVLLVFRIEIGVMY